MMVGEGLTWDEIVPAQVCAILGIQSANLAVSGFASDQATIDSFGLSRPGLLGQPLRPYEQSLLAMDQRRSRVSDACDGAEVYRIRQVVEPLKKIVAMGVRGCSMSPTREPRMEVPAPQTPHYE